MSQEIQEEQSNSLKVLLFQGVPVNKIVDGRHPLAEAFVEHLVFLVHRVRDLERQRDQWLLEDLRGRKP